MDRRAFIAIIAGGVVLAPFRARGQQTGKIYRIGLLSPFTPSDAASWNSALLQGLHDLGWFEGKNIAIERRYSEGKNDRLADLAAELVRLKVDVIVTAVTPDSLAAKNATRTIPIVMAAVGDPVESGLVQSLGRPGGNITGLTQVAPELGGKRLQLLKEIDPRLNRVAVLWNPLDKGSTVAWKEIQQPARELGMALHGLEVSKAGDFDAAFEEATRSRVGALALMPDTLYVTYLKRIADFALNARLLSIFHLAEFVQRRRPDRVRTRPLGPVSARCDLRGQDPEGREAIGTPRGASDEVPARYQPQYCEGDRGHDPTVAAASRR